MRICLKIVKNIRKPRDGYVVIHTCTFRYWCYQQKHHTCIYQYHRWLCACTRWRTLFLFCPPSSESFFKILLILTLYNLGILAHASPLQVSFVLDVSCGWFGQCPSFYDWKTTQLPRTPSWMFTSLCLHPRSHPGQVFGHQPVHCYEPGWDSTGPWGRCSPIQTLTTNLTFSQWWLATSLSYAWQWHVCSPAWWHLLTQTPALSLWLRVWLHHSHLSHRVYWHAPPLPPMQCLPVWWLHNVLQTALSATLYPNHAHLSPSWPYTQSCSWLAMLSQTPTLAKQPSFDMGQRCVLEIQGTPVRQLQPMAACLMHSHRQQDFHHPPKWPRPLSLPPMCPMSNQLPLHHLRLSSNVGSKSPAVWWMWLPDPHWLCYDRWKHVQWPAGFLRIMALPGLWIPK